jgi:hypothetical protein
VSVIVAGLVVVAALPYVVLAAEGTPAPEAVAPLALLGAQPLGTYLLPSRPPSTEGYYFLGWVAAGLAAVGAVAPAPPARRGLLVALAVGWVIALGYAWRSPGGTLVPLPLGWAAAVVPGFGAFRAPVRLGLGVAVAAAALAGLGWAAVERVLGRWRMLGTAVVVVLLVAQMAGSAPVPLRAVASGATLPAIARWLADAPRGPVLEVPVGVVDEDFRADVWAARWQSGYQYASTVHWQRLLNGYSAHPPDSFYLLMTLATRLPAADSLQELVDLSGVRWLVVHRALLAPSERAAWDDAPPRGATRRATLGDDDVFEVELPPRRDLQPLLRDPRRRPTTLGGLSRAPLPPDALRGELDDVDFPARVPPALPVHGRVTIVNRGTRTWPGFDPDRRGLVGVAYRWRDEATTVPGVITTRLARDLAPGEAVRIPFTVLAPAHPGAHELVVTLRQHGGPWFDEAAGVAVRLTVRVGDE